MDSSGPMVSMRCTSDEGPSVATVSAWVSPRVNSAEPWARGSRPTSTVMGRMVSTSRPSMRTPSVSTSSRTVFLCSRPREALGEARLDLGGVERGIGRTDVPAVDAAPDRRGDSGLVGLDPTRQVVAELDEQRGGRLRVGQRPVRRLRQAVELGQLGQLVGAPVGVCLAGEGQGVEVPALRDPDVASRRAGSPGRSRRCGRRRARHPRT